MDNQGHKSNICGLHRLQRQLEPVLHRQVSDELLKCETKKLFQKARV